MTSSHIFYIPVLILVGFFAGFFIGRRAAEVEAAEAKRKRARRRKRASASRPKNADAQDAEHTSAQDAEASSADDGTPGEHRAAHIADS